MTTQPAPRRTPARKPKSIRVQHVTVEGVAGEPLTIPYTDGAGFEPPEVQVLSVDRIEGHGMGNFRDRWHLALVWRS